MARVKLSVLYPSLSTSSPTHVGQHRHADASSSSCLASPTVAASPRSPPSRLETGGGQAIDNIYPYESWRNDTFTKFAFPAGTRRCILVRQFGKTIARPTTGGIGKGRASSCSRGG